MTSTADVVTDWAGLMRDRSPAKRHFDPSHPLDLLYGSDPSGKAVFALVSAEEPPDTTVSRDVSVAKGQRTDKRWTLALTLNDSTLFDSFSRLCLDLVTRSGGASTEEAGVKALFKALDEWKLLLRRYKARRLSPSELRGLVGELWFGFRVLVEDHDASTVANSWKGPLDAPQDFEFLNGHLCEVKARRPKAASVAIASVDQLDPGEQSMSLAVVTLEDCDSDTPGAFSLMDLLSEIRGMEDLDFVGRNRLDHLVQSLGVDEQDKHYAETLFSVLGYQEYRVDESFPSIRSSTINSLPVTNLRYDLVIEPLFPFLTRDVTIPTQGDTDD